MLLQPEVTSAAGATATYAIGGNPVVKRVGYMPAPVDDGVVVCDPSTLRGIGGTCIPFSPDHPYVKVVDDTSGKYVPFVVCIDNDGDGGCNPHADTGCADDAFASHDDFWVPDGADDSAFFNPLGPLPTAFRPGCPGGAFPGYVVFLCQGVHAGVPRPTTKESSDIHPATTGTVTTTTGEPSGFGDLCISATSIKRYAVVS